MKKEDLHSLQIPDNPGVYFFLGENKKVLYIGKATSLRNRVRSYFALDIREKRSELIENMVREAITVEWTETESVLEALILETNLIRSHKPRYNTRSKDDKSYNHLVITNEEWPRVLVVRAKDLTEQFTKKDIKHEFGPFPNGGLFREALKIVRKLFKYYDTKIPVGSEKSKVTKGQIDFNRQIGLFPDVESRAEYLKTIRHIKLFFEGKKQQVIKELKREMMVAAKKEEFEKAASLKRRVFALEHIRDVSLLRTDFNLVDVEGVFRIESYDIAHMSGQDIVGVMTVVHNQVPVKQEYRKFKIQSFKKANDPGALREMLHRRLSHKEWPKANLLVVDGAIAQKNAMEAVLRETGDDIPVVAVVKDSRHKPIRLIGNNELLKKHKEAILLANAEAHRFAITFHKQRRRKSFLQ